jgi:methyl-accepting chemotaxis protein
LTKDEARVQAADESTTRDIAAESQAEAEQTEQTGRNVQLWVMVAVLIGLVTLSGIGIVISRSITRPIRKMVGALQRMAAKDLTVEIDVTGRDEIGDMARALAQALTSVREAISLLAGSSGTLAAASEALRKPPAGRHP